MTQKEIPKYNDQSEASLQPRTNPLDRYAHLPESTRAFIESLDREDIEAFTDLLKSYKRAATIGWFFKWLILGMVGTFMAAVSFGEAVVKSISWVSSLIGGK